MKYMNRVNSIVEPKVILNIEYGVSRLKKLLINASRTRDLKIINNIIVWLDSIRVPQSFKEILWLDDIIIDTTKSSYDNSEILFCVLDYYLNKRLYHKIDISDEDKSYRRLPIGINSMLIRRSMRYFISTKNNHIDHLLDIVYRMIQHHKLDTKAKIYLILLIYRYERTEALRVKIDNLLEEQSSTKGDDEWNVFIKFRQFVIHNHEVIDRELDLIENSGSCRK